MFSEQSLGCGFASRQFSLSADSVSVLQSPEISPPVRPRSFWQRRVRDPIVAQLTQGITPQKIALTLAMGSAFGLFPILGLSTVLCFLVAWAFKLNQPIIQLINQALWPVHVPVIFLYVRIGEQIFGVHHARFSLRFMNELFWKDPRQFMHTFGTTALYAIVGWLVLAPLYAAAIYFVALPVMKGVTRIKAQAAAKAAEEAAPVDHPVP
jgi:uncharacterized protein (DUF2062 family)